MLEVYFSIQRSITRNYGEPGHTSLSLGKSVVAGWGVTQNVSIDHQVRIVASSKQRAVKVPVVSNDKCNKDFNNNIKDDLQ